MPLFNLVKDVGSGSRTPADDRTTREEEIRVSTRERQAGSVNVRKRVRTDREQLRVPTRHEEVNVERVPVEEGRYATPSEIGEDEVVMPVAEEELVTEKRSMVKKEIRVCKDVVEEEEVIEEDVRKEEIDVEDSTTRGGSREAILDDAEARHHVR